jgi:hypothetical protein
VLRAFGSDEPYGVTFMLSYISEGIKSQIPEDRRDGVDSETFKTRIRDILLAYVDKQLVELRQLRPVLVAREQTESDHLQAAAMLPAPETLDKLLRYETALKRHLYRAMHQLERLQRMRKGEEIPPPMAMTV